VGSPSFDVYTGVDIFLLLLVGIGPKIALVPYLDLTEGMDQATKARVVPGSSCSSRRPPTRRRSVT
jgi:hypothetical protein